ncbi:CT214 family putative inclusion membrane protein [Chlamydia sp. 17-3921]|uniref:CT214 family putative inclusion membrane protein n=1 Tax=Chlamydia sp. 17-3921 TaxID=2675798 RepID=UPI00191AD302|nr:hypothetical protein [Chlamydia sp. 17-3921]
MVSLPEAYSRIARHTLSPEDKQVATSILKRQTIALISAVSAAALLLAVVLLQLIPGIPIAVGVTLGVVAIVLSGVAIGCLISHIRATDRLTEALSDSIEVMKLKSLEESRPSQYKHLKRPTKVKKRQKPKSIEIKADPRPIPKDIPSTGDLPSEETTLLFPETKEEEPPSETESSAISSSSGDEEEVLEQHFMASTLDLRKYIVPNKTNPSVASCPFYKKRQDAVKKALDTLCKTVSKIVARKLKKEPLISREDITAIFNPIGSKDSVILSVLSGASELLSSSELGATWLHNAFHNSENALQLLVSISEAFRSQEGGADERKNVLLGLNIVLTGWIFGDPNLYPNIVGSVQSLPNSSEEKEVILNLLENGNIIGSIISACSGHYPNFEKVILDRRSLEDIEKSLDQTLIPRNELSPKKLRRYLASIDTQVEESNESLEEFSSECQKVLGQLEKVLPNSKILLGAAIAKGAPEIVRSFKELKEFFDKNKKISPQRLFRLLDIFRKASRLQKVLKTYLPSKAIFIINGLIMSCLRGAFVLGIPTLQQRWELATNLKISESELTRLITTGDFLKHLFPDLIK